MDLPTFSSMSTKEIFAKIQANLEEKGAFQVGKCHGKPTAITPGSDGSESRPTAESLVRTQLPRPLRAQGFVSIQTNKGSSSRSPSPIVVEDSNTPTYFPLCVRTKTSKTLQTESCLPSESSAKPTFPALSWAAPSFDAGLGLSSFASSLPVSKKRSREDIAEDEKSNTATAKIAAAAATGGASSICLDICSGPRFTEEEADDLVAFADKWIPTKSKRARK